MKKLDLRKKLDLWYRWFLHNLLLRSSYVSIHQRHLEFLGTDILKSICQINPEFTWSFFNQKKLSHTPPNMAQMLFIFDVLLHGTIFLLNLIPAV